MCAFGKVLEGCLFFMGGRGEGHGSLSAKAKGTISAKKGTAMACNVTHEMIVARARKCSHHNGFRKNQAVTRGPQTVMLSSLCLLLEENDLKMTFKS